MTFAIGRPSWARSTAVRSLRGTIHIAAGWNAYEGTRTRCGRTLKHGEDFMHVVSKAPSAAEVEERFDSGGACTECIRVGKRAAQNA